MNKEGPFDWHCAGCGEYMWGHIAQLRKIGKGKEARKVVFCLKCDRRN